MEFWSGALDSWSGVLEWNLMTKFAIKLYYLSTLWQAVGSVVVQFWLHLSTAVLGPKLYPTLPRQSVSISVPLYLHTDEDMSL